MRLSIILTLTVAGTFHGLLLLGAFAGRFRREHEGATLRENLGLPPPPSRWTQGEALARGGD